MFWENKKKSQENELKPYIIPEQRAKLDSSSIKKKKKPKETFQKKTKVVRFTINDFCFGFHSVNCHHHHYLDPKWQQQLVGRYISHRFRKKNFAVSGFGYYADANRILFLVENVHMSQLCVDISPSSSSAKKKFSQRISSKQ